MNREEISSEIIKVGSHFVNLFETKDNAEWRFIVDPSKGKEESDLLKSEMIKSGWQAGWPYCYDGNVEILTESGWVKFKDLTSDHGKVAQVSDDLKISFCEPLSYINKKHSGKIADIKTRSVNIITDDGHNFFGRWNQSEYQLRRIDSIGDSLSIPNCKIDNKINKWTDEQIMFIAAFIADGTIKHDRPNQIHFGVSKERKILSLSNFNYHRKVQQTYVKENSILPQTIFTFWTPEYFSEVFTGYKEISIEWVMSLTQKQCKLFIETYTFYDGFIRGNSNTISTVRKQNAELLSIISLFSGYKTKYRQLQSTGGYSKGTQMYEIRFSNTKHRSLKGKQVNYTDVSDYDLYCVEVPHGKIIIKDFDGNIFVCGNCMAFSETIWRMAYKNLDAPVDIINDFSKKLNPSVMSSYNNFKGSISKEPVPGSIFFMQKGTTANGHAGIVVGCDGKSLATLEANTSPGKAISAEADRNGDGVYKKIRSLDFTKTSGLHLLGFLHPIEW